MSRQKNAKKIKPKLSLLTWLTLPLLFCMLFFFVIKSSKEPAEAAKSLIKPALFSVKVPEYSLYDTNGKGAVTLLFNNAWKSQNEPGFSYLKRKNVKAAVSVSTNFTGSPYWDWTQLQDAQNNGWEIVSLGKTYNCEPEKLDTDEITSEVLGSKQELLKHSLYAQHFVSPCGKVDMNVSLQVANYYNSQLTGESGINYLPVKEKYLLKKININNMTNIQDIDKWLNDAKQNNGWIIFTFNQIEETGPEPTITFVKFQEAIKHITESGIAIVVPSQILEGEI